MKIERQPSGKAKVIAHEEIKTRARDINADAHGQLDDQRGLFRDDLPDLTARRDAAHPAGVAAAMAELHGHGIASLDGAFFVAPDAEDPRKPAAPDRSYIIARLAD